MKIYCSCLAVSLWILFSSCQYTREAYYMSPSDVRATPYVTLPMAADPEKAVTAAGGAIGYGNANQRGRDNLIGGSATLIQSRHFGHFQAYYGAAVGMGDYDNSKVTVGATYYQSPGMDSGGYNIPSVKKFYGYYGLNGGINLVIPFANGKGEWRALGMDLAYRKEFGDYLDFRRSQPADKIAILASYDHLFTLGASTEIVGRNARDFQFGYKVAAGGTFLPSGQYSGDSNGNRPYYFSQTFQVTKHRVTCYLQLVTGVRAYVFQTGINVNLTNRTHIFPVPERKPRRVRPGPSHERPLRPFEKRKRDESGEHD